MSPKRPPSFFDILKQDGFGCHSANFDIFQGKSVISCCGGLAGKGKL